jgi:ubiquitin C-terminal hydrolase
VAALLTSLGAALIYYASVPVPAASGCQTEDGELEPKDYVALPNLGNTCYLNSLLQALSGCPHYLKYAETIVER